jgi:hypothetical protein
MARRKVSLWIGRTEWPLPLSIISFCTLLYAAVALALSVTATDGHAFEQKQLVTLYMTEAALILFLVPLPGIEGGISACKLVRLEPGLGEAKRFFVRQMTKTCGITLLFCLMPCLAALSARVIFSGVAPLDIVRASVVILSIAICALAIGFCCSVLFKDHVSAAAAALFVILLVCTEPIWFGPVIDATSDASFLIQPSLMINPIAGLASALDFDILRTEPFYTICPIGQRRFSYPLWYTATLFYLLVSLLVFWGIAFRIRRMATPSG